MMDHTVPEQSSKTPHLKTMGVRHQLPIPFIILLLTLLACNMGGKDAPQGRRIIKQLPTLTPTVVANLPPEPETNEIANPTLPPSEPTPTLLPAPIVASTSGDTSVPIEPAAANEPAPPPTQTIEPAIETLPTSTETPIPPTLTPTPLPATATPTPEIADWSFAGIRTYYSSSGRNLSMYGDVINNTGTSQKLALVTANFYDEQGQLIAGTTDKTVRYWPIELIPSGERLPFKLTVLNIENVADFELSVEARPIDQIAHQDFEISDVAEGKRFGQPCLQGRLRNVSSPLQEYVFIVGVLYNDQDQMLQFSEHNQPVSGIDLAAQPLEFEICFNLNNPDLIARHELRAWGQ